MIPYLYKNPVDHNVTANGECYRAVVNYFFMPELEDVDADYRTCHATNLLRETFGERINWRHGTVAI